MPTTSTPITKNSTATTKDVIKEYWKSAKRYWLSGISFVIGVIISTIAGSLIVPLYYKRFFDTLVANIADPSIAVTSLVHVILIILGLNMITWASWRLFGFCSNYFYTRGQADLRDRAFEYLIGHSYAFFTNNFTGSLTQRVNRFGRSFQSLVDAMAENVLPLVIRIVGAIIVVSIFQPIIALALFIWVVLFIISSYSFARFKLKYDIQAAALDSKVTATMSDAISNHNVIQLFTGAHEETSRFSDVNWENAKLYAFRWNLSSTAEGVQALLSVLMEFFIFYYAIRYWSLGLVSIGTFALIQAYLINIGGSLWNSGYIVRSIYESLADAKEMVDILNQAHEIKDIPNAVPLHIEKGAVEFKNVTFAFSTRGIGGVTDIGTTTDTVADQTFAFGKKVLDDFSVSIRPGEKVAFIGSSGAGKSTLVKLLMRLYDIRQGEILIDGQNIANVTQDSLRENVSLVPQDPALFHRTLMENIRYGRRTATDEEVIAAAKLAHCDEFIDGFPLKYQTYVGERGVKLSGGERQRVAIARAIIKNAPILVLDEATSSLDSHSESLIQDALRVLMEGKTTIVIAHRLSTIRKMDRIIVIGNGGIIEEGTHEELIKHSESGVAGRGLYAKLWSLQAGGFADKSIEELFEKEGK